MTGQPVTLSIGKDKYGEAMKKDATTAGDNVHYYEDEPTGTGTCGVCVVGGERSLNAIFSAANCYKVEHLKKPENWALVEKAKFHYIAGFFLAVSPESIQLVREHAAANKVFTINLSAPFICEFFKDVQEKCLPYMDYAFGNETEARTFSRIHGWETDDVDYVAALKDLQLCVTFMMIHLLSALKKRCSLVSVMTEVDRILRPQGTFIVRDDMEKTGEIEKMVESLIWNVRMTHSKYGGVISVKKSLHRPTEVETITPAIASERELV